MSKQFLVEQSGPTFTVLSREPDCEDEVHFSGIPTQNIACLLSSALETGFRMGLADAQIAMGWWPTIDERHSALIEDEGQS